MSSDNIGCPGTCVKNRIARYCEAYLTSADLCVSGKTCCVSRDGYSDKSHDLVIPNEKYHTTRQPTTTVSTNNIYYT